MNTIDFNAFITECILPKIPLGAVIVLDNAAFHKSTILEGFVEIYGRYLLFLPPYSPDLNPIEISYGWLKKQLKVQIYTTESIGKASTCKYYRFCCCCGYGNGFYE